jgi:hypothetical protein
MARLAFLDTETTGLDVGVHQVWEVAVALDDGPIQVVHVAHGLAGADPAALELNGYAERVRPPTACWRKLLLGLLTDVTLVGSNPGFDAAHLRHLLGAAPWNYRTIDVATGVMWLAGWDEPRGLQGATYELRRRGYDIPMPDHTAAGDVATVRAAYHALRAELAA